MSLESITNNEIQSMTKMILNCEGCLSRVAENSASTEQPILMLVQASSSYSLVLEGAWLCCTMVKQPTSAKMDLENQALCYAYRNPAPGFKKVTFGVFLSVFLLVVFHF